MLVTSIFSFSHDVFKSFLFRPWNYNKRTACCVYNTLPNEKKSFDLSKLKIKTTQLLKFVLEKVENIVGKGENAGYQHFLLLLQCFQKLSFFNHGTITKKQHAGVYNTLQNEKNLNLSKLKINITQSLKFVLAKVENIVGNG